MLIGYVRVSTNDQNTDLQRNALVCAGCEQIFEDKLSGTRTGGEAWKKYRVLLNRVDTSTAPDIEWPEEPDTM